MCVITIKNSFSFASNMGVMLEQDSLALSGDELKETVHLAFKHLNDPLLADACCGAQGPLAQYTNLDFEEYIRLTELFTNRRSM